MYIPYNYMCYIPYTPLSPTVERTATVWLKCCWNWLLTLFKILLHHLKTRSQCRIKLVWTHVTKGSYVSQSRIKLVWTHVTKESYVSQSHIRLVWTHVTKGSYVSQSRIKLVWAHVTKGSYVSQSRIKLVCPHVTKGPYIKNIKYTYILNHNLYTCITRKFNIFIYYFENAEPVSYATFVNRLTGYC